MHCDFFQQQIFGRKGIGFPADAANVPVTPNTIWQQPLTSFLIPLPDSYLQAFRNSFVLQNEIAFAFVVICIFFNCTAQIENIFHLNRFFLGLYNNENAYALLSQRMEKD